MATPKNERGQTLILMLIVTVISLTIGVAISSRAVSTLKQTSYTAQAGKAQKAADAGAEEALIADLAAKHTECPSDSDTCVIDLGDGTIVNYYVEELGGGDSVDLILEKDETVEIDLTNYNPGQGIDVYWVRKDSGEEDDKAALVLTFIYENGGETTLAKYAYDPIATRRTDNNFDDPLTGDFVVGGETYKQKIELTTPSGINKALRIRALYNETAKNTGLIHNRGTGNNFPTQGYKITSKGTYSEAEWTTEVTKMNPALPSIFDYAIFSDTSLTK